jgi:two-component system chemotaxis sensor kinase CheA
MNSDFSPELQSELMDDFYAEADEYFTNIRAQLAALESSLKAGSFDRTALESLFRSMHSLKGISAIVVLRDVEQLAHAAEDFLRQLSKEQRSLNDEGLQVLMDATTRLEQIVSAHRLKKPPVEISSLVRELGRFAGKTPAVTPTPSDSAAPSPTATLVQASRTEPVAIDVSSIHARGLIAWRCLFSPSKDLDARGINVGSVRQRLSQVGEIISATPRIASGGSMTFDFVVAFRETPADLAAWETDGLLLTPIEVAAADVPVKPSASSASSNTGEDDQSSGFFIAPSHFVRVDLARLDELMRLAGDLVIQRSRLDERLQRAIGSAAKDRTGLHEVNQSFARTLRDLRQAISAVRMVSVAEIFARMPFVVRDLARETGKQARLVLQGQQTEVDKFVVERLKEPLLHLVRNALSHGVETPSERVAAGKPAEATLRLHASTEGDWVVIRVRDDGRGVDAATIVKRATLQGLPIPKILDQAAILNLLCTPGFSTREEADLASGRGVGMAVVQNAVRQLAGSLSLNTELGHWTEFTLRLPLTLSIMPAFIVHLAGQSCAIAQHSVEQILQIESDRVRVIQKTEIVPYRDGLLPLVRLRERFGFSSASPTELVIVVVSSERGSVGLVVDRVLSIREVVVRAMADPLVQVPGISGATELGDGRPVLILDTVALTSGVVRPSTAFNSTASKPVSV